MILAFSYTSKINATVASMISKTVANLSTKINKKYSKSRFFFLMKQKSSS